MKTTLVGLALALAISAAAMAQEEEKAAAADSFKATLVGTVQFVDAVDFLGDGTPVRLVVLRLAAYQDEFLAICIGPKAVNDCGRLRAGRKATMTGVMGPVDALCGETNGIGELYTFNVSKAVGR